LFHIEVFANVEKKEVAFVTTNIYLPW
jgi:hypothetical protein